MESIHGPCLSIAGSAWTSQTGDPDNSFISVGSYQLRPRQHEADGSVLDR